VILNICSCLLFYSWFWWGRTKLCDCHGATNVLGALFHTRNIISCHSTRSYNDLLDASELPPRPEQGLPQRGGEVCIGSVTMLYCRRRRNAPLGGTPCPAVRSIKLSVCRQPTNLTRLNSTKMNSMQTAVEHLKS
jgi:hypothetical protein